LYKNYGYDSNISINMELNGDSVMTESDMSNVDIPDSTLHQDHDISYSKIGRYIQGDLIIKALYGGVYHCIDIETNQHLCMKVSLKSRVEASINCYDDPKIEIIALEKFRGSKLIVGYHTSYVIDDNVYIIMDYYPLGDILTYLKTNSLNLSQAIGIFKQMLDLIVFFEMQGYAYLDFSCENFVVESVTDTQIIIRCVDFGSITRNSDHGREILASNRKNGAYPGKPGYVSPELCDSTSVVNKDDLISSMIYMAGTTMFVCLMKFSPHTHPTWNNFITSGKWMKEYNDKLQVSFMKYGTDIMKVIDRMIKPLHSRIGLHAVLTDVSQLTIDNIKTIL
jgi:serine/threonine protein kinase